MSIENEVKVRVDSVEEFLARLRQLGPVESAQRHFEDNFILDDAQHSLASRRSLIRVRTTAHGSWLTFKGPPQEAALFKRREELETCLGDGIAALAILRRTGLRVTFRYQKYRREFRVAGGPGCREDIHVALDETPIGVFVEFEGPPAGIKTVARRMAISEARFLRDSYASLYIQYCAERGQAVRHMTFRSVRCSKPVGTRRKART